MEGEPILLLFHSVQPEEGQDQSKHCKTRAHIGVLGFLDGLWLPYCAPVCCPLGRACWKRTWRCFVIFLPCSTFSETKRPFVVPKHVIESHSMITVLFPALISQQSWEDEAAHTVCCPHAFPFWLCKTALVFSSDAMQRDFSSPLPPPCVALC